MGRLGVSSTVALLPTSVYMLGLAFGPILGKISSELLGRKAIYMIAVPLFAIFTLASGLLSTVHGLIICRFFAGFFAGPGLSVGTASLSDVWEAEQWTIPLLVYRNVAVFGLAVGPLIGGYVVQHLDWRWTQYVVLFAFAGCMIPIIMMRETHKAIILRRRHGDKPRTSSSDINVKNILTGPMRLLLTKPLTLLWSLYVGLNLGITYAIYVAFHDVFIGTYGFNLGQQGLAFLALASGVLVGLAMLLVSNAFAYRPRVARWEEKRAAEAEKAITFRRQTNRSSQTSQVSRNFSRPTTADKPAPSESAVTRKISQSSRASSAKGISTPSDFTTRLPMPPDQKNINLAVAAADYLHTVPENQGRRILPECILLTINKKVTFGELCSSLEHYKLSFDKGKLAQLLIDAMPKRYDDEATAGSSATDLPTPVLNRSRSMHRAASAAALESGPLPLPPAAPEPIIHSTTAKRRLLIKEAQPASPQSARPPPEWRLWPALPASIIVTSSLFILAWTPGRVHWMGPVFALGLFGCGSFLATASGTQYINDLYGEKDGANAVAGMAVVAWVLSATFPLFALPMYSHLGTGWATSIFGFLSAVLGMVPLMCLVMGRQGAETTYTPHLT